MGSVTEIGTKKDFLTGFWSGRAKWKAFLMGSSMVLKTLGMQKDFFDGTLVEGSSERS